MEERNWGRKLRAVEGRLRGKGEILVTVGEIRFTEHRVEAMREFSI